MLFVSTRNRRLQDYEYHGEARRLSRRSVAEMIARYGTQAGLPADQLHPHALRHLYGTEMTEDDQALIDVKSLMGHADIKTTEIYTQLARRRLGKVVDKSSPINKIKTPVTEIARRLSGQAL